MKPYTVVLKSDSPWRFNNGVRICNNFPDSNALLFTDYKNEGMEALVPRELIIEIHRTAPDIFTALNESVDLASNLGRMISTMMNCYYPIIEPFVVYSHDDKDQEHEFFQHFKDEQSGIPKLTRIVDPYLLMRFLKVVNDSHHASRVNRTIAQYTIALN